MFGTCTSIFQVDAKLGFKVLYVDQQSPKGLDYLAVYLECSNGIVSPEMVSRILVKQYDNLLEDFSVWGESRSDIVPYFIHVSLRHEGIWG